MATGSSLSKGVRRKGEINKLQSECPSPDSNLSFGSIKGSNQGDSDSGFTSFTASMHGSTSSEKSSIDQYSSGMEGRIQRKKALDKSNSKKRWSFRFSKRSSQSPSLSLPDDRSATTPQPSPVKVTDQKPVLKITRSGSLRSLKIVRSKSKNKSKSSSESKGSRSNRATFSSTLKDSKFPEQVAVDPPVGEKESEEILQVAKLCPYQHCSLHGHHHHHHEPEPPVKRFSFLKRRSSKDQKGINPKTKTPATIDKPSGKKTEVKESKNGSNVGSNSKKIEKGSIKKDVDFSIEFYAKTRTEHVLGSSSGLDDANLADIMFDVNGNNQNKVQNSQMEAFDQKRNSKIDSALKTEKEKYIKMWHMIYQHVVTDITSKLGSELLYEEQEVKDEKLIKDEFSPIDADMLIRQSVKEILLPEDEDDGGESEKQLIPKNWNKLKKLRRSIKDLESCRFPKSETPKQVDLKRQMSGEKTKAEQWMIDYAVQHIVTKLTPARKKRVSMLVEAFEAVIPLPET